MGTEASVEFQVQTASLTATAVSAVLEEEEDEGGRPSAEEEI